MRFFLKKKSIKALWQQVLDALFFFLPDHHASSQPCNEWKNRLTLADDSIIFWVSTSLEMIISGTEMQSLLVKLLLLMPPLDAMEGLNNDLFPFFRFLKYTSAMKHTTTTKRLQMNAYTRNLVNAVIFSLVLLLCSSFFFGMGQRNTFFGLL